MTDNWRDHAACLAYPPEMFFPGDSQNGIKEAIDICNTCAVKDACLDYAITSGEWFGVWGGETVRGRRRILKQRRAAEKRVAG